jgi:hypothetical protein
MAGAVAAVEAFLVEDHSAAPGQIRDDPKAHVVPGSGMAGPGIPEPRDQLH